MTIITQAQAVTGLGVDLNTSWQRILAGESSIRPVRRFSTKSYVSDFASCVKGIEENGPGSRVFPLLDLLFEHPLDIPEDSDLLMATTKAGIDTLPESPQGQGRVSAEVFPHHILHLIKDRFRLKGQGRCISGACASSTIALALGAERIASGHSSSVLVLCFDLVTEFVFSGFSSLRALSPEPCRPFDTNRLGLSLGEGAAALVLMDEERARSEERLVMGKIRGWGMANDATHITAPAKKGTGLKLATKRAFDRAGLGAEDIQAINAHGTGTIYNDLMELTAFNALFDSALPPLFSVKGALGHTLGAAGGIEAALGLLALKNKLVPPTIGCEHPEAMSRKSISPYPVPFAGRTMLTTNSGFGGINSALILENTSNG